MFNNIDYIEGKLCILLRRHHPHLVRVDCEEKLFREAFQLEFRLLGHKPDTHQTPRREEQACSASYGFKAVPSDRCPSWPVAACETVFVARLSCRCAHP